MKHLPLILLASTSVAHAQTQCTFTTECFEDESCTDTTFNISYSITGCPHVITAETDFGTLTGSELTTACNQDPSGAYTLTGDGASYLLSIGTDGTARLTSHTNSPISISYLGQCQ